MMSSSTHMFWCWAGGLSLARGMSSWRRWRGTAASSVQCSWVQLRTRAPCSHSYSPPPPPFPPLQPKHNYNKTQKLRVALKYSLVYSDHLRHGKPGISVELCVWVVLENWGFFVGGGVWFVPKCPLMVSK